MRSVSTSAGVELVDAEHSHASAAKAVELVRAGRAEALMKGSLHTDELMGAVVSSASGIRTERRISHCFIMDVPGHPDPLIITDAAVNIAPDLDAKVDIIQNAIDLAHAMGARAGSGGDLKRDGDRDDEGPLDDRSRGPVQDGGARADHRRDPRRAARARQRDQPGSGGDQEDRVPGCGAREHSGRSGPRGRQHARQEPVVPGEGGRCGNRARRARADHSHQPRRFAFEPPRFLRRRRHGRRRQAQGCGHTVQ